MTAPPARVSAAASLAAAALLTSLAIARLPPPAAWFRAPETPFDRSDAWPYRSVYLLLRKSAAVIPAGATVTMRAEPRNPASDEPLFRTAVALLPGRRILRAAVAQSRPPEYLVLLGSRPSFFPGRLLLEANNGSVWRRSP